MGRFFRDSSGRLVVIQLPNPALWVWLAATALRASAYDSRDTELRWIGTGALIVWGLDELVRGASPFRRLLGAVVLAWQLANVF
ncbi:hypothetical protein ASC61_06460 [Aeromicrobium sp. Root344]|uniref:hypothetical protein n=1 Tax=Aeromicrobium sp. Root344 TaxID=1736521 RepID=UPI0006F974F7|nr:hypothetical protein [Aeromicrobium sp. Root344]KQV74673.1 hypothetical protein ASC61_06460 [Aeromicrobium sp. Root344]